MSVLCNKSLFFLLVLLFTQRSFLRGKPLISGAIVEIISLGELTYNSPVWVSPSNWKIPEDGPKDPHDGDYELMVGESPMRYPQRSENGCQLMMITSVAGSREITYNDPVTISALSSYGSEGWIQHSNVFDVPRLWWTSTSARHPYGFDVFASHPLSKETQGGRQLFTLVSPNKKNGPVNESDVFWILSRAPGVMSDARVWPNESRLGDPFYKLEVGDNWGIEKGGGDRSLQRGRFTCQEVKRDNLDKIGRKVYDKVVKQQKFRGIINPPQGSIKISWFGNRVAIGQRAIESIAYCVDTNGDLFQLDQKEHKWFQVAARIENGNNLLLKDVSMSSDGQLYVLDVDGLVYRYQYKKDFFQPLTLGRGNENLRFDYISVGSQLQVKAVDLKTKTIYKYQDSNKREADQVEGWIKTRDGVYCDSGKNGAMVLIDSQGQTFLRGNVREKGKKHTEKVWRNIAGIEMLQVAVGSRRHIWGLDNAGRVWKSIKRKWVPVKGNDGTQASGFSGLDINSKGDMLLVSQHGDTYHQLMTTIKKKLSKKVVKRLYKKKKIKTVKPKKAKTTKKKIKKAKKAKGGSKVKKV